MVDHQGRLSAIDFNWASVNGNYSCGTGVPEALPPLFVAQNDSDVMLMLERMAAVNSATHREKVLQLSPPPPSPAPPSPPASASELHLIVLWDPDHPFSREAYSRARLAQDFRLLEVRMHPSFNASTERVRFMNAFYEANRHGRNVNDARGTKPFALLYATSLASARGPCEAAARARGVVNCSPTNRFKAQLRLDSRALRRRHGFFFVHGTDSPEEARANFAVLGEDYDVLTRRAPTWANVSQLLAALTQAGVAYVVARDVAADSSKCAIREARGCRLAMAAWQRGRYGDLDLLVDRYSDAVRAMGAIPALPPWEMSGMGGERVAHEVRLASGSLQVDLRSPGDGYLDESWVRTARVELPIST